VNVKSDIKTRENVFRSILANVTKSSFVRNLLIVMSGTALAQILGYALSPIISRLFSPSDFGVFGSFYAIVNIIAAGLTLDYGLAIVLPREKNDAANLFALSCLSTLIISAGCLIVTLLSPGLIKNLIKAPGSWVLVLFIIAIFVSGINQTFQAWSVRVKAFKQTSASQVIRSLSTNGTQVGLGYLKGGATALILTSILGDILASANLAAVVLRDFRMMRESIHWGRMKQLAKEYRDFPIYSASMSVVNTLSLGLPIILLTRFYGIAVAGAYAFGSKIIQAPMGLIQRPLRQVLYQKACETHNEGGRLLTLYLKFTIGLFAVALLPSLVIMIWGPQLFMWIFGTQWHLAGVFTQSLILWFMFMFCNLPADLCTRIARMQRTMAIFDVALLAVRTAALYLGGKYLSAVHTVLLFSIVGAGMNAIYIVIIGFALKKRESETTWRGILNAIKEGQ